MDQAEPQREFVYYWPHWAHVEPDGTISVKGSVYDDQSHSSVHFTFGPQSANYQFWLWLIEHPNYQRAVHEDELLKARELFEFESSLLDP